MAALVLVVALRIFDHSYSMWDLVPQPGIEPRPPAQGVWSLSQGNPHQAIKKNLALKGMRLRNCNTKHRWAEGDTVGSDFLSVSNSEMVPVSRENSADGIGREGGSWVWGWPVLPCYHLPVHPDQVGLRPFPSPVWLSHKHLYTKTLGRWLEMWRWFSEKFMLEKKVEKHLTHLAISLVTATSLRTLCSSHVAVNKTTPRGKWIPKWLTEKEHLTQRGAQ